MMFRMMAVSSVSSLFSPPQTHRATDEDAPEQRGDKGPATTLEFVSSRTFGHRKIVDHVQVVVVHRVLGILALGSLIPCFTAGAIVPSFRYRVLLCLRKVLDAKHSVCQRATRSAACAPCLRVRARLRLP